MQQHQRKNHMEKQVRKRQHLKMKNMSRCTGVKLDGCLNLMDCLPTEENFAVGSELWNGASRIQTAIITFLEPAEGPNARCDHDYPESFPNSVEIFNNRGRDKMCKTTDLMLMMYMK